MNTVKTYLEENRARFLEELFELLRIPSVSSDPAHKPDMYRAAETWKSLLLEAGADRAQVMETEGHPLVYAEKILGPALPTVLVYAHMDVMPVDPIDKWLSDPFEPVIREGKIWARGADDDKGQSFIHLKAFEYMVKTGTLPCNVKFMIEGEEEMGSPSLPKFCADNRELLQSDVILISDTTLISLENPSITTGLRGLAYWQVEVIGPNRDLHSGLFGGAVANPINILCKMLAACTGENGRIRIPGFYDDVADVSEEERVRLNKRPYDESSYKKSLGVNALFGEEGYSTTERTGSRPTFDICGIWGGYTGEGSKTVIPAKAFAKVSSRLVPNQDHQKIARLLETHLQQTAPETVRVRVDYLHGGQAYVCPIDHPAYIAAEKALEQVFGKTPIPFRSGGSIPIVAAFEEILGVKSLLLGFGLESDAIHSPNENFPLENLWKGIETIPLFYHHFSKR
ncbi:MAG TPA: dipeptidase [Prolixibacteraceae bacterium]|nr:dipeptidase [Prolixibacteraceae bacterium]